MSAVDVQFNRDVDDYRARKLPAYKILDLGLSPRLTIPGWVSDAPIKMKQFVLDKAVQKHILDLGGLGNLPSRLQAPVAIFRSATVANSFVVLINVVIGSKPVVVALHHTNNRDFGTFLDVKSVHAREYEHFTRWQEKGYLLYVDKEKSQEWLQDSAPYN